MKSVLAVLVFAAVLPAQVVVCDSAPVYEPCEITVEFKHTLAVDELRFRPGVVRVDDRTISVTADTWWEAWKAFYF